MKAETKNKIKVDIFTKAVHHFVEYLGLVTWRVDVRSIKEKGVKGTCYGDGVGRVATISYSKKWLERLDHKSDMEEIAKVAFHECAELFLHNMYVDIRETRDHNYTQARVHEVIRMLENKLFPIAYKQLIENQNDLA